MARHDSTRRRQREARTRAQQRGANTRKLTELCGELVTLGERCTVTNAMVMRHRRLVLTMRQKCSLDTILVHARTIVPSGARETRHFSRTFDSITLATAMFDTVDRQWQRNAHAHTTITLRLLVPFEHAKLSTTRTIRALSRAVR